MAISLLFTSTASLAFVLMAASLYLHGRYLIVYMVLLAFVYRAVSFLFTCCFARRAHRGDGLVGCGCHGFCDFIFGVEDIHRHKEACSCLEQ